MELVHRIYMKTGHPDLIDVVESELQSSRHIASPQKGSIRKGPLRVVQFSGSFEHFDIFIRIVRIESGTLEYPEQYLWIDVESDTSDRSEIILDISNSIALNIANEISNSDFPFTLGGHLIETTVKDPRNETWIQGNIEILLQSQRPMALIAVCYDPLDENVDFGKIEVAKKIISDFGAVARVIYFTSSAVAGKRAFDRGVGRSLTVQPGEIRIYPPNEIDPVRVIAPPAISAQKIRTNDYGWIQKQIFRVLQPYLLARTLPDICVRALHLLKAEQNFLHTDYSVSQDSFQSSSSEGESQKALSEQIENLLLEIEKLRSTLLEAKREIEDYREENLWLQDEILRKDQERRDSEEWWVEQLNKLEGEKDELESMAIKFNLSRSVRGASREHSSQVSSVKEAIEKGRNLLPYLVIPDDVSRQLDELDRNSRAESWARSIFQAFLALCAYAEEGTSGNFYEWNKLGREFSIPQRDIAIFESDNVRQRERLRNQRILPVSKQVEESGRVFMESHIKFHGNLAPRLYFFDDTDGPTGKIHIGGIDPHSRWENTTT